MSHYEDSVAHTQQNKGKHKTCFKQLVMTGIRGQTEREYDMDNQERVERREGWSREKETGRGLSERLGYQACPPLTPGWYLSSREGRALSIFKSGIYTHTHFSIMWSQVVRR